ncbi:hypothetical protein ACH5RR_032829 [Cinchona calisaya]|uniref:F-box domain-containing protein n=1 Tax=Cinchona calisaya TaxID=153742 RepID=A0ABD2YJ74_9GENT
MDNKKSSRPNWSELNQDLLELIVDKLSYVDILRFKAVCTSWLAATERFSPGPLLILPSNQETDHREEHVRLGAFSVKDKTIHDLNLVVEKHEDLLLAYEGFRVLGSSHGWLVAENSSGLYLLNIFSRTCKILPGKATIPAPQSFGPKFSLFHSPTIIRKAILTSNPSLDDDYKVIIIYGLCENLAFCGFGDDEWKGFSDCEGYYDIVWYNMLLYTLRGGVNIEVWDFSDSCFPTKKMCIQCSYSPNVCFQRDVYSTQWYLVPSLGEILFIVRYIGEFVNNKGELLCEGDLTDEICPYKTFKFQVYKVDMIERKLEQVKSLKDRVMFVGGNHGISVSAKDYQELEANSIYFTDDYLDRLHEDYSYGGHDFGLFRLKDENIGSIFELDISGRFEVAPFWVFPN